MYNNFTIHYKTLQNFTKTIRTLRNSKKLYASFTTLFTELHETIRKTVFLNLVETLRNFTNLDKDKYKLFCRTLQIIHAAQQVAAPDSPTRSRSAPTRSAPTRPRALIMRRFKNNKLTWAATWQHVADWTTTEVSNLGITRAATWHPFVAQVACVDSLRPPLSGTKLGCHDGVSGGRQLVEHCASGGVEGPRERLQEGARRTNHARHSQPDVARMPHRSRRAKYHRGDQGGDVHARVFVAGCARVGKSQAPQ
jgi:hypothetical protein